MVCFLSILYFILENGSLQLKEHIFPTCYTKAADHLSESERIGLFCVSFILDLSAAAIIIEECLREKTKRRKLKISQDPRRKVINTKSCNSWSWILAQKSEFIAAIVIKSTHKISLVQYINFHKQEEVILCHQSCSCSLSSQSVFHFSPSNWTSLRVMRNEKRKRQLKISGLWLSKSGICYAIWS